MPSARVAVSACGSLSAVLAAVFAASIAASAPATDIGEPPISVPISGCGEVVYDEECQQLFRFDFGGLYSFSGLDQFAIGDRLFVDGDVCLICLLTPCGSPYSAILGASVSPCKSPPDVAVSGCMEVVADPVCGMLLLDEDGVLYHADGWLSAEQAGLRFHAEGFISSQFLVLCPDELVGIPFFTALTLSGCTGDLDNDGGVDGADLGLLLNAWGSSCMVQDPCLADLSGDGLIDGTDLGILLAAWD